MWSSDENRKERNKRLKVKAFQVENQLNQMIKDGLNHESILRLVEMESEWKAEKVRRIREQMEVLSLQYNFPTKNDVANIARLLIQLEEKIDRLEEHMHEANPYAKKNMVKIIMQDMMQRQAIVSQLPGTDTKVVRPEAGEYNE